MKKYIALTFVIALGAVLSSTGQSLPPAYGGILPHTNFTFTMPPGWLPQRATPALLLEFPSTNGCFYTVASTPCVTNPMAAWPVQENFIPGNGSNIMRFYAPTCAGQFFAAKLMTTRPDLSLQFWVDQDLRGTTQLWGQKAYTNTSVRCNYAGVSLGSMDWRYALSINCNYFGAGFDLDNWYHALVIGGNCNGVNWDHAELSESVWFRCDLRNALNFGTVHTNSNTRFYECQW